VTPSLARPYPPSGYQMIKSIDIRRFRCFEHLRVEGCRRVNVIVGDNGTGKTALLEAMFLALAGGPEIAVRFRQQRGLEGTFNGPSRRIEEALWKDLFFHGEWNHPLSVELEGSGPESRSVVVSRGQSQLTIPLATSQSGEQEAETRTAPIVFRWRDSNGKEHIRIPKVTPQGLQVEGVEEDLPDFFYSASNQTIPSVENAGRFSELSRSNRAQQFVKLFTEEYPWIEDLAIEVLAGAPAIYATMRHTHEKLPLPNVSGGINRIISILLTVASRDRSVVLVDELENGLYHKHHVAMWRALLLLCRHYESQLFATTHNEEWLGALFEAASGDVEDIALWRIERANKGPILRQFSGRQTSAAIKKGEVR
jgi:hypothetical protein